MTPHPEVVLIVYEDMAYNESSYDEKGAARYTPILMSIVGFLVCENEQRVVISKEWNNPDMNEDTDTWRALTAMPRVGIKSMVRLVPAT